MFLDGMLASDWSFQESLLGQDHCVAVCTNNTKAEAKLFETVSRIEDLLSGLDPLPEDSNEHQEWMILGNMTQSKPF